MKKILVLGLLVVLSGCKESSTGLDKNVINTAYKSCYDKLKLSLKSPSSLRINNTVISMDYPNPYQVFRVYTDKLIDGSNGKILVHNPESKNRFRELKSEISYEAQNSFGVFLPGEFSCSYVLHLSNRNSSPYEIRMASITNDDNELELNDESFTFGESSNLYINNINKIIIYAPNDYTENDNAIFDKATETYETSNRLKGVKVGLLNTY